MKMSEKPQWQNALDATGTVGAFDFIPNSQLDNPKNKYDHVHVDTHKTNGRSSTLIWFPGDTQEYFQRLMSERSSRKLLELNGWVNSDGSPALIHYKINKQGFRHDGSAPDLLSDTGGVMYVGDSNTFGVGNRLEDTFTYKAHRACSHTKNLRYINFGCPGYGIETQYRLLKYYIKKIVPDYVILSMPWMATRSEEWDERNEMWKTTNIHYKEITQDDVNRLFRPPPSFLRWYKNLDAMKWICHEVGAKFYAIEEESDHRWIRHWIKHFSHQVIHNDWGRDLMHPGIASHDHNGNILKEIMEKIFDE